MKTKVLLVCACLAGLVALAVFLWPSPLPISPLGNQIPHPSTITHQPSFIIMGFAPYWNLKKLTSESLGSITHFAYFTLHLSGEGELYTHVNRREQDPGYTNYLRLLQKTVDIPSKPMILTFMPIDQDALVDILASSSSRTHTATTITSAVIASGASGVNIDFEPVGDVSPATRHNFLLLVQELQSSLCPSSTVNCPSISISIYASAGANPRLWDLASLSAYTNYFVVMAYDYTMPTSATAGPGAPLRDAGDNFEHNILKNIAQITRLIPASKVLLGIPLYGYQWDTSDDSKYARTEGRGVTASLERVEQMLRDQTLSLLWDRNSLTAYGVASHSGQTSQVYFENETSLSLKLEFVKSAGLGGIALWALGYDNGVSWLWPTIDSLNE